MEESALPILPFPFHLAGHHILLQPGCFQGRGGKEKSKVTSLRRVIMSRTTLHQVLNRSDPERGKKGQREVGGH